jgi:hypothetical protein
MVANALAEAWEPRGEPRAGRFFACGRKHNGRQSVAHLRKDNCRRQNRGKESDLGSLFVYMVKDCLICRVVEAGLDPPVFVIVESGAQAFWAVVEGVSKRFMDTVQCIFTGHKNLCWC